MGLKYLKYFDWILFSATVLLSLLGIMMIYSTGLSGGTENSAQWVKQAAALALGLLGLFTLASIDYRLLKKASTLLYLGSILLLAGVLVFSAEIRGSRSWFDLGFFNFQPAEISKLALIVLLAKFFQAHEKFLQKPRYALWSLAYVLIPALLIMRQPDLGSALVHLALWGGVLILSRLPKKFFLYLIILFLITAGLGWQFGLADYQKTRVYTFLDPARDPLGSGYNVIQSIVAVGSGGLFGRGLARGLQSQLKFLPERQTDFIFAATSEELGFLGGSVVILLLALVLYRNLKIISQARDLFGMYLAGGIFFLILFQSVVNIGMNLGLLPVTGITLPFLSYGGSSLMVSFWLIGILESVARHAVPVHFK